MLSLRHLLPVLLLAGCAALPARAPQESARLWQARQQALSSLATWDVRGRIALRSADQGVQASLQWTREGERQRLTLVGPLGSGHVRLTQDARGAELRDAEKRVYRAPTARELLVRVTGWDMPLEGMNWWVLGLPAPGIAAEQELDDDGRLRLLTQSGWEIEFLDYGRFGAYELPTRVFLRRRDNHVGGAGLNQVTLEVRVVIERWVLRDG